jgi:hypothetical protein
VEQQASVLWRARLSAMRWPWPMKWSRMRELAAQAFISAENTASPRIPAETMMVS